MTLKFTLTQGNREIPLIFDPTHQDQYKLLYGYSVGASETQPRWHTPTEGASQLIDLNDQNSTAFFTLDIAGVKAPNLGDDINKAIATLRKWIDGEEQEAARYHIIGDNNPVELKIRRSGSEITTVWGVLYGWINDAAAHYTASAKINNFAFDVVVALTLAPYGKAETWDILKNELVNPDVLLVDGVDPNLADGWTIVGGAGNTFSADPVLIGSQSQAITAPAIMEGIESPSASSSTDTDCVAYIWVHLTNNMAVNVIMRDVTAGSNVTSKQLQPGDATNMSDKSYIDEFGNVWYRVSLSASTTLTNNVAIRVLSVNPLTNFVVDGAYLEFGRTNVPAFWASYYTVRNREDTTPGSPEYINHINYWGIAGDMPALAQYYTEASVNTSEIMYASKVASGVYPADFVEHWFESANLDTLATFPSTFTSVADGSVTGGQYWRYTQGASPSALGSIKLDLATSPKNEVNAFISVPRRMFIYARSSVSTGTLNLFVNSSGGTLIQVDEVATIVSGGSFELYDLGLINLVGLINDNPKATSLSLEVNLQVGNNLANGDTIDFDCFVFFYNAQENDFVIVKLQNSVSSSDWWIDGERKQAYTRDGTVEPALGGLWTLKPEILTKTCFLTKETSSISIANTYEIETYILAQTKHLLGVL